MLIFIYLFIYKDKYKKALKAKASTITMKEAARNFISFFFSEERFMLNEKNKKDKLWKTKPHNS